MSTLAYLASQNIPSAVVFTLGNKVVLLTFKKHAGDNMDNKPFHRSATGTALVCSGHTGHSIDAGWNTAPESSHSHAIITQPRAETWVQKNLSEKLNSFLELLLEENTL